MIQVKMGNQIIEMRGYEPDGDYVKRAEPKMKKARKLYPWFLEFRFTRLVNGKWYEFFRNSLDPKYCE